DDIRGIGLAVRHLAALGHRRIAHIAGPAWLSTGAMRSRGFQLAMAAHARGRKPVVIEAETFSREAGAAACVRLLDQAPDVTARRPRNGQIALGCHDPLAGRGIACPAEVSVPGYNDAPSVDMVSPPLTTVRIRQREMGIEAARVLLARMNGQEIAADTLLRP